MRLFIILLHISLLLVNAHSFLAEESLLIYTLDGNFTLVDKYKGTIRWTYNSQLTNDCAYPGNVILIPEIHEGHMYEYAGSESTEILYLVNSTFDQLFKRSPGILNKHKTKGYKTDHWIQLDFDTGKVIRNVRDVDPKSRLIEMGIIEYRFMLFRTSEFDPLMNITFQRFPDHIEPDLCTSKLKHVTTLEPSVVTFDGDRFLWHLSLSAPVVDIFSIKAPKEQEREEPEWEEGGEDFFSSQCSRASYRLRRVAFTSYALSLSEAHIKPNPLQAQLWEAKLGSGNEFKPSLYLGESPYLPLYIIHTLAEESLPIRPVSRASDHLQLEYKDRRPCKLTHCTLPAEQGHRKVSYPKSLIGLYHISPDSPKVNEAWSSHYIDTWRFTAPPPCRKANRSEIPLLTTTAEPMVYSQQGPSWMSIVIGTIIVSILTATSTYYYLTRIRAESWNFNSRFLDSSFDNADEEGWAGCPLNAIAAVKGTPAAVEAVRFNVNSIIGTGANGTLVYLGTYGQIPAAIKRVVRSPELDQNWQREHEILKKTQHVNLINCYWTGTTQNFHYLALQLCTESLFDAMKPGENEQSSSSPCQSPLNRYGLTPIRCVRQLVSAIEFLHSESIVHRDIKPSNIFILESSKSSTESNRLVLGDFGLSKSLQNDLFINSLSYESVYANLPSNSSNIRSTFGSLGWMAPEMCTSRNGPLTKSVDVFALGLVAYFIFTHGRHPFHSPLPLSPNPSTSRLISNGYSNDASSSSLNSVGTDDKLTSETTESSAGATAKKPRESFHDAYFCLASVQAMQRAIIEKKEPLLSNIVISVKPLPSPTAVEEDNEPNLDEMYSCLAKQFLYEALGFNSATRCSIDVLARAPLFWSPTTILSFFSDISNFIDEPKVFKYQQIIGPYRRKPNQSANFQSPSFSRPQPRRQSPVEAESDPFNHLRQALVAALDENRRYVFTSSWLQLMDPVILRDLNTARSYQDRSLSHLLRAIRNKRNHIWGLPLDVRQILGDNDEKMNVYWNSKFPSLLPVVYFLARVYLTEVQNFKTFLPSPMTPQQVVDFFEKHCRPIPSPKWQRLARPVSQRCSPPKSETKTAHSNGVPPDEDENVSMLAFALTEKNELERYNYWQSEDRMWHRRDNVSTPESEAHLKDGTSSMSPIGEGSPKDEDTINKTTEQVGSSDEDDGWMVQRNKNKRSRNSKRQ